MVATMSLGLLTTLITTKIMFISFKKSLDPEIIVFPAISTMADIIITFLYVGVLNLYFSGGLGKGAVTLFGLLNLVLVIITLWSYLKEVDFLRIIRESLATLLLIAIVVNITGTALRGINVLAGTRREIFIVYPALIDLVGDVGLIVGSTATTKLALGELTPSFSSIKNHAKNIFSTWLSSILLLGIIGVLALVMSNRLSVLGISSLLPILFLTNIIAFIAIVIVSFAISIVTFERGLDPDNFVIPIISTLADCITTIVIVGVLILIF
jgi:mgtE-like transporter